MSLLASSLPICFRLAAPVCWSVKSPPCPAVTTACSSSTLVDGRVQVAGHDHLDERRVAVLGDQRRVLRLVVGRHALDDAVAETVRSRRRARSRRPRRLRPWPCAWPTARSRTRTVFCGPVMRSSMRRCAIVLSGCGPCCFISDVRPLPSSEPTPRTATTTIASQMPTVRHGWVALLRARRSVNEAVRPPAVLPVSCGCHRVSLLSGPSPLSSGLSMDMSGPTRRLVTAPARNPWAAAPARTL